MKRITTLYHELNSDSPYSTYQDLYKELKLFLDGT